ncbi:unnamed protein product [Paramecium sonneborni]|uniref:Uncharacterized protein n=1 Tax=Paramecium sonneborni TaxID=65129 RepID=A0A8S1RPF4_9CILI|nr:unnamed protein product [Paramecium sonneborni]
MSINDLNQIVREIMDRMLKLQSGEDSEGRRSSQQLSCLMMMIYEKINQKQRMNF